MHGKIIEVKMEKLKLYLFHHCLQKGIKYSCWLTNRYPYTECKKKPRREAGHPRLVGFRLTKQENSLTSLVLGGSTRSMRQVGAQDTDAVRAPKQTSTPPATD